MPLKRSLHLTALAALLAVPALAALQKAGDSEASFTAKGPAGFKMLGKTGELRLEEQGSTVRVAVPLGKLETGIALRDKHMRDTYLEVAKYPEAVLEVDRSRVSLPADGQTAQGQATGTMRLHGHTREVPFHYVIKRSGDTYQVQGDVPLNLNDYDIHVPAYLGITVKPDIEAGVSFRFKG